MADTPSFAPALLLGLPSGDIVALLLVFALWQAFTLLLDHSRWAKISLTAAVNAERLEWMRRITQRDNRVADTTLLANLMRSVSFFASATIIILGGVAAMMGTVDRSWEMVQSIPFAEPVSKTAFEAKLLLLAMIFIYCFLKFTWGLRQFNYCCILLGGAPMPTDPPEERAAFAARAARVNELGARSFNQGLRGYYFALACLGWFIHPLAFVGGALGVVLILWRREFHSRTRRALRQL